jgi:hypothetical protein
MLDASTLSIANGDACSTICPVTGALECGDLVLRLQSMLQQLPARKRLAPLLMVLAALRGAASPAALKSCFGLIMSALQVAFSAFQCCCHGIPWDCADTWFACVFGALQASLTPV